MMCNSLIIWLFLFVTELRQSSEWSQRPANLNKLPACSFFCLCKQVAGSSVTPIMTGRSIAAKPPVSSILGRLSVGEAASVRGERNECEASSHPVTAPSRFFCQLCQSASTSRELWEFLRMAGPGGWDTHASPTRSNFSKKKTHRKASLVFCNHENVILLYFSQSVIVFSQVLQVSFSYNCNWLVIISLQPCNSVLHFFIVCSRWRCPCSGWSFRWHQWHWAVFLSLVQIGCGEAGRPVPSSCPQAPTPSD